MCPCCFVLSVFYSVFLNARKGRLAKEGSLAPHTREKLSEIIRGVTASMNHWPKATCPMSFSTQPPTMWHIYPFIFHESKGSLNSSTYFNSNIIEFKGY